MSRFLKITVALGVICAAPIVYYLVRPASAEADTHKKPYVYKPLKGVTDRPANAKALAGNYFRGDYTGYNVYLTLNPDGTYSAEWHGCLGNYGNAAGDWMLADTRITFTPSKETDMMRGHLRSLEVLKFQGYWIFVPAEKDDRERYDQWGIAPYTCFQNTNHIVRGP